MHRQIRLAIEQDALAISRIYNHYVERSTCTFDFERESLDQRLAWIRAHGVEHPATVCEVGDDDRTEVVGWGSLSPWHARPGYSGTVEVSFYVHHDWHRQGIGRLLLKDLIDRARQIGHHSIIGRACEDQIASIKLQQSFGFVEIGRYREIGRKFDRWWDVLHFQLVLD